MHPRLDRRSMLYTIAGACGVLAMNPMALAQTEQAPREEPGPLDRDLINEYVDIAHFDLEKTKALVDREPRLIRASWDWGGGDFKSGLGAAGHSGRTDIAKFLLDQGAPLELCAAATLGFLDVVRAALEARPSLLNVAGPHGIPLIAHARSGGDAASKTVEFLIEYERRTSTPDSERTPEQ